MTLHFQRTRLAPSPTGALHLGHARTFLIAWWMARQANAKIFMRMEDLDAGRATQASVEGAYADLRWLGMDWDAYEETRSAKRDVRGEVVQSQRLALYQDALERLEAKGDIYCCTCTRAEIAAAVAASIAAPHESDVTPRYPGTCADLGRAVLSAGQCAKPSCWRLRTPPRSTPFHDLIAGPQSFNVHQEVGDFPLTRFDGTPAYQLACVVDDHAMGIDLVVRGDDLLPSTPRQLLVYEALGWTPPQFAHVPLVIGPDGKRLAKRHGESRISQFRAAGLRPERIIGWVAWRSGQTDRPQELAAAELVQRFSLARLPRERIVISEDDLAWLA